MAEKTALDAINEALGTAAAGEPDANAPPPEETTDESTVTTDTGEDGGSGSDGDQSSDADQGSDEEGDEAGEGDETGEEGEGGDGTLTTASTSERNPDGTFKKKEDAKKQPDPVNDPIPKELKKETRDRMQSLVDTVKTKDAELVQVRTDFDFIINGVKATGASPEQYGETLSWLQLFNSPDPKNQEKALELAESVCERLATFLGKERPVGDPLKGHADLQEAVRLNKLTPEYAKEIARTRNGQTFRTELTTTAQTRQQQVDQAKQVETQARADLTALEENLRAVDGKEYDAIKASIVPVLKPVMAALNPAQWREKFTAAYKAEKDRRAETRAAAAANARPKVPANQPLRGGKNPAGGQARQPSNALEAMNGALSSLQK